MKFLLPLLACVLVTQAAVISPSNVQDQAKNFSGYTVYKAFPNNITQRQVIDNLEALDDYFNFWRKTPQEIDVMINPVALEYFEKLTKSHNIETSLWISNVQSLIDGEQMTTDVLDDNEGFTWTRYHTLDEIYAFLDDMLARYPNITESIVLGNTYEGRPIRGIKISHKNGNPGVFIESNIHAREWITSASATWFIKELLTSQDPDIMDAALNHDWYIIPVLNVDGFIYSHNVNRMWRKNREPLGKCFGVDINRNFDCHWMENQGASDNPCAESYAGPEPFSTPEAKVFRDYVLRIKDKINYYITVHSYSQLFMYPYGYSGDDKTPIAADLSAISKSFVDAVAEMPPKTEYAYGSTADVIYVASGISNDWAYDQGMQLAFTVELRDKGRFGFILPPVQIIPVCQETMAGLIASLKKSRELGYMNLKTN